MKITTKIKVAKYMKKALATITLVLIAFVMFLFLCLIPQVPQGVIGIEVGLSIGTVLALCIILCVHIIAFLLDGDAIQ